MPCKFKSTSFFEVLLNLCERCAENHFDYMSERRLNELLSINKIKTSLRVYMMVWVFQPFDSYHPRR